MKLLNKNIATEKLHETAATKIAGGILQTQNWFAETMKSATSKWKLKQQWIFLCIVCIAFGGLSILAMASAFRKTIQNTVRPEAIIFPKPLHRDERLIITDKEFRLVQDFKQTHPELMQQMPGLADSLTLIEQIYFSQKNK
jgi:hypothetical protein